jgi:hypothetical protein
MAPLDPDSLVNGLVRIGEDAVAKSDDALFYAYYTDDYQLHSPAGASIATRSGSTSPRYARASPTSRSAERKSLLTATSLPRAR